MTIFCYCPLISIERIRPTRNWLCLHKLKIAIDFLSSIKKNRAALFNRHVRLPSIPRWAPKSITGKEEHNDLLEQERKSSDPRWGKCEQALFAPATCWDWLLHRGPSFSPVVWCWSLTTPGGRVQCHSFVYLPPPPERWTNRCAAARPLAGARRASRDIVWGRMWQISQSLLLLIPASLILTRPSLEPGGFNWSIAFKKLYRHDKWNICIDEPVWTKSCH